MSNNSMLYSLKVGTFITKILPRKLVLLIAKYLGLFAGLFPSQIVKNIISVHKIISPELNRKDLKIRARNVISYYAQYWVDVFWLSSPRSPKDINKVINVEAI